MSPLLRFSTIAVFLPIAICSGLASHKVASGQDKSPKGTGQRYAILVAIDDYTELEDLKYCSADQLALRQSLVKAGFPDEHVFVLHDGAQESKYRPYKHNIERQLDLVLNLTEREDVLLFGFSGHGAHLDGKSYLLPAEANVEDKTTLISRDKVYQKLQDCRASLKVALIDACRDDPRPAGRRSATAKEDRTQLAKSLESVPEGLLLFTSCAPGEISMEDQKFGHGVFMNFILEGMQGKADADNNRAVTLKELFTYAGQKTKLHVARTFNGYQTPRKNSAEADAEVEDFALVRLDKPLEPQTSSAMAASASSSKLPLPARQVTPGEVIANSIGMKLVEIPAGEFEMGAENGEVDEKPAHRVSIGQPFYLGMHEVTLGQFLKFYHASGYKTEGERDDGAHGYTGKSNGRPFQKRAEFVPWNTGFPQTNEHPVVNISWNDAQAFCAWLSRKEGKHYRLPTEAEWEYACRAGTTTKYSTGDTAESLAQVANFADASLNRKSDYFSWTVKRDDGFPFTAPVASFKQNGFGLHDMHGNVREWCQDWYNRDHYPKNTGAVSVDPQGPLAGHSRVMRGGGWVSSAALCRSAFRSIEEPSHRGYDCGFRVALSSP